MFDLNGDGYVHLREFEEITRALQKRLRKVSGIQRTGAKIQTYVQFAILGSPIVFIGTPTLQMNVANLSTCRVDSSRGLKNHFFGVNGDKPLRLEDFADFIRGTTAPHFIFLSA